jgi:diacylglycerol kinase (ATP)
MRAAVILGTKATGRDLRPFQFPNVELVAVAELLPDRAFDAALIFGGDGSVHRQLPSAVASQSPLLCVPTGSGNDFARALGLGTVRDALTAWQRFCAGANNVRSIDVAEITFLNPATGNRKPETGTSLYCCVAGAGLDSEINRRANALPAWLRGHGGYVLSLAPALATFQPPQITIELFDSDGPSRIQEPAMMVAFANTPSYGHGMRIAPRAQMEDGKLDVCFVRRLPKRRLLRWFPLVFSGGHLRLPEVVYAQCSGVSIASERPLDIFGDGEFIGRTPAQVRVRPRALRVIGL